MCGRYLIVMEDEIVEFMEIINEINKRYKDSMLVKSMAMGEIFPTNVAPVLVRDKAKPKAMLMKWGFPKWRGGGVIINARAETALEKKSFRYPLVERRCVVPTTGFFEWRQDAKGKKIKHLFRLPETKMLYLAGLYNSFDDGNVSNDAYVILTTPANSSVEPYHNRMPLILGAAMVDAWLSDTKFALNYTEAPCNMMLNALAV